MKYEVFCDDKLLFKSGSPNMTLKDPNLDLEVNKAGSFTFVIYPDHIYYGELAKLKSIITVRRDGDLLFRGRILNDEKGWLNEKNVFCEGELAFLVDSVQRPYDFMSGDKHATVSELFEFFINRHNEQIDDFKKFKVGRVTVTDSNNYIVRSDTAYKNTWDSINEKLLDPLGGYLWVRHEADGVYLDYLADFTQINPQPIEFGKNLLDLKEKAKGENIITALIPLGKKEEESEKRLTIEALPDETDGDICKRGDYVYSKSAVAKYGWIFGGEDFDNVGVAENLLKKAKASLSQNILFETTIEITAADLAGTSANEQAFKYGRYISAKASEHGVNDDYLIKKMSLCLTDPGADRFVVGASYKSFTEQTKSASQSTTVIKENITKIENNYSLLSKNVDGQINSAVNQSSQMIIERVNDDFYTKGQIDSMLPRSGVFNAAELLSGESMTADGYAQVGYRLDGFGTVHLSGAARALITSAPSVLFILPDGFRPLGHEMFAAASDGAYCTVDIFPNGFVSASATDGAPYVSLSGITFKAKEA